MHSYIIERSEMKGSHRIHEVKIKVTAYQYLNRVEYKLYYCKSTMNCQLKELN